MIEPIDLAANRAFIWQCTKALHDINRLIDQGVYKIIDGKLVVAREYAFDTNVMPDYGITVPIERGRQ